MRRAALAGAVLLIALAACAPPQPGPRLAAQDTAIVALRDEPETLFAPTAASAEALTVLGAMTEGLVVENENGDLEARLAERVPTVENGDAMVVTQPDGSSVLAVRFRLRETARWQDGTPVRAADIRFGWMLVSNGEVQATQVGAAARIKDVRAIDERTVEVVYRAGDLDPRYALCCNAFVLPAAQLRDVPAGKLGDSAFAKQPIYAGPFAFKERQGNSSLTVERSPYYVLAPAKLRTIVFRFRSDPDELLQDLSAHRIDVATGVYGVDAAGALATIEPRGVRVAYTPTFSVEHLDFNLRDPKNLAKPHPILAAREVRAALALAIDRDRLAMAATAGRAPVPVSYVPPSSWTAPASGDVSTYAYDPTTAERSLDAVGWRRAADGIREKSGVRMQLRLVLAAGNAQRDQAARQIADSLGKIGVSVTIEGAAMGPLTATRGQLATGQFDLALYAWVGDRDPYGWSLLYHRGQIPSAANGFTGQNFPGWSDERFSKLADEAAGSLSQDVRRSRYAEMHRVWTAALPALPLYQRVQVDVADVRLREFRPQPTRRPLTWNAAMWSFAGA